MTYPCSSWEDGPARETVSDRSGRTLKSTSTHRLLALTTRNGHAIFVLASKQLLLVILDDDLVVAMRTLLEAFQTSRLNLLALFHAFVQTEELRREEPPKLGVRERELATGLVHAHNICVVRAEECLCICSHAV